MKNRLIGKLPKVGIRPVIDGREWKKRPKKSVLAGVN